MPIPLSDPVLDEPLVGTIVEPQPDPPGEVPPPHRDPRPGEVPTPILPDPAPTEPSPVPPQPEPGPFEPAPEPAHPEPLPSTSP